MQCDKASLLLWLLQENEGVAWGGRGGLGWMGGGCYFEVWEDMEMQATNVWLILFYLFSFISDWVLSPPCPLCVFKVLRT